MAKESNIILRCTPELKESVKLLAQKENRTVSSYIETLIKRELEKAKS